MAHNEDPHSATSQFIFNLMDNAALNNSQKRSGFTVFGRVVEGMEVVDTLANVLVTRKGAYFSPVKPVRLIKIRRNASMSVADIITEAKAIDDQLARVIYVDTKNPRLQKSANRWLDSIPSTEKPSVSISGSLYKFSTSLLKLSKLLKK